MEPFVIEFYQKADGSYPAEEFLLSLDKKLQAKLSESILLLKINGSSLRAPYSKSLGDGIFELRTRQGSDSTRILYFFFVGRRIVLTNGFVKKSQKTPTAEIAAAKRYRAEYLKRRGKTP